MQQIIPYKILDNSFLLSADKCIYWEEEKTLILSDLHFGKSGHFRKSGIAVPQNVFKEDIQRFVALLQTFKPENVLVIGDMFHSRDNKEHALFVKWRKDFEQLNIQLVKGNHDILQKDWYSNAGINIIDARMDKGSFSFVHDITEIAMGEEDDARYFFSGHIHPGFSIMGMGKQALRFPCFYFARQYAVLPAFGKFTGTHPIKPKRGETVYAVMAANQARDERAGIIKVF
jgi:DNA ligase-associated metallophosphoesterase